jgi:hypothetical protein
MEMRALTLVAICGVAGLGCSKTGAAASGPTFGMSGGGPPSARLKLGMAMIRSAMEDALVIQDRYKSEQAALLAMSGTGLARILHRGRFPVLEEPREGGAYYSFATRSNSYNDEPDLGLELDYYRSGFYGGSEGFIWDLGTLDLVSIDPTLATMPATLPPAARDKWDFFDRDAKTTARDHDPEMRNRARELKIDRSVPAVAGHTYLLRAILDGEHDHAVAFTTLETDDDGHTIAWRILRSWPVPHR